MAIVPSSRNRRRVEVPAPIYDRMKEVADDEGRTVASLATELLRRGLQRYSRARWIRRPDEPTNLTARAERVLGIARDAAPARFDHNYVGTEHLLLALVEEGEGPAARSLARFGVTTEKVAETIGFMIGRGREPFHGTRQDTPRTRHVVELAGQEARQLDHAFVGSGHILLGLIREGEGIAAGILESLGVDMLALRDDVLERIGRMPLAET